MSSYASTVTVLNYLYGGVISKYAHLIYFHVHVANVCDHLYTI